MENSSRDSWHVPSIVVGFDTETTGLVAGDDEPISYALTVYVNGQHQPSDDVEIFVRSDKPVSFGSQQIHGLSDRFLDDEFASGRALRPLAAATQVARHISRLHALGAHFVGANPDFDFRMLAGVFHKNSVHLGSLPFVLEELAIRDVIQRHRDVDVADPRRRSLSYLCRHYGVVPGGHDALADAHAAVQVFFKQDDVMATRRSPSPGARGLLARLSKPTAN
jgi:DNA polymerase-3 subunit epsilon